MRYFGCQNMRLLCLVFRGQDIFFSSQLLKPIPHEGMSFLRFRLKIHGPCLTTEDDKLDIALDVKIGLLKLGRGCQDHE